MRLLIVGNRGGTNIGGCFVQAASELGLDVRLLEASSATDAPLWLRRFNWWFRGKRPTWLNWYGLELLNACRTWRPDWLLATGTAPIAKHVLREISNLGVQTANYLTDDPWNPAHRAAWFLEALPFYQYVFSLRRSNLDDLSRLGCPNVSYLPFAYAPELHFPESNITREEREQFASDVAFVGSGDAERVPYIEALIRAKFKVGLYGSFWERFPATRRHTHGQTDVRTLRIAIGETKVALCLVRRANRDGNSMRTFEVPAIGACMLAEDTEEHRQILGREGEAVLYFSSVGEMVEKAGQLLTDGQERRRLAAAAHALIVNGRNTYKDRLVSMLRFSRTGIQNQRVEIKDR